MAPIKLLCIDKPFQNTTWLLHLSEEQVVLTDPDGKAVTTFSLKEADKRLLLPSFWESIKGIGVRFGPGQEDVRWFQPDKETVAEIRTFQDWALAAQGPEALQALRTRGWLYLLGGIALAVVGIVVLIVVENEVGNLPRGARKAFAIAVIFGLIGVYQGIKAFRRVAAARRVE
jgi:hypothetical protein